MSRNKKKKKKRTRTSASSRADTFDYRPLAKLKRQMQKQIREDVQAKNNTRRSTEHADPPPSNEPAQRPLSARELFEYAVEQMDEGTVYDMKFGGGRDLELPPSREPSPPPRPAQDPDASPPDPHLQHVQWAFEQEMADLGIERLDQGVQRVAPKPPTAVVKPTSIEPARPSLSRDELPTRDLYDEVTGPGSVSLSGEQQRLLQRARKLHRRGQRVPEISLRGLSKVAALNALEGYLENQAAKKIPMVRIITGKGKRSADAPVIKHATQAFFEGRGAVWVASFAPEVNRDGNFGAFIVQLRATAPDDV